MLKDLSNSRLARHQGCCEYALEEFGEGTSVVIVLGHPQVDQLIVHGGGLERPSLMVAMLLTAAMDWTPT